MQDIPKIVLHDRKCDIFNLFKPKNDGYDNERTFLH